MKKILLVIAILSIYLHAIPITLNNTDLVTKLEKFTSVCSYYSKTVKQPQHIRQQCQKYKSRLDDILKTGYRLDRSIPSMKHTHLYNGKMHTCTAQSRLNMEHSKLYKYYDPILIKKYETRLFSLDKLRDKIIEDISLEKTKARKSYDVEYHEKLIRKGIITLYNSDYTFIAEHRDVYINADNPRYIQMLKDKREELLSEEQRVYLALQLKKEEKRKARENAKWLEECGYNMTAERHYAKKGGKLSGTVSGSDPQGYFVENRAGGEKTTFYVIGGPLHTGGYVTKSIYVTSKGNQKQTTSTSMSSGVKVKGMALVVYYNDTCVKNSF